jgi:two-component system, chemotaxis family, sensor kinase CheA
MMDQHRETYRVEALELLSDLETALLNLEKTPDDEKLVGRIFRAMHTIKGSGAMFGFDEIASFTHDLETIYDRVRNHEFKATEDLIDLTLKACDHIKAMVTSTYESNDEDKLQRMKLLSSIRGLMEGAAGPEESATSLSSPEDKSEKTLGQITYRIRFKPHEGVYANGTRLIPLLAELHDLGTCRVIAHTQAIPYIEEMSPENCYTAWDIILTTGSNADAIRDVFIFVDDLCELKIWTISVH